MHKQRLLLAGEGRLLCMNAVSNRLPTITEDEQYSPPTVTKISPRQRENAGASPCEETKEALSSWNVVVRNVYWKLKRDLTTISCIKHGDRIVSNKKAGQLEILHGMDQVFYFFRSPKNISFRAQCISGLERVLSLARKLVDATKYITPLGQKVSKTTLNLLIHLHQYIKGAVKGLEVLQNTYNLLANSHHGIGNKPLDVAGAVIGELRDISKQTRTRKTKAPATQIVQQIGKQIHAYNNLACQLLQASHLIRESR